MNLIKKHLKELGRTQAWLSQKIGVDYSHLSRIVRDKSYPSLFIAYKIAKALEKQIEELWILDDGDYKPF